jgi:branched-chain amino acid transport system substrate-binding protein
MKVSRAISRTTSVIVVVVIIVLAGISLGAYYSSLPTRVSTTTAQTSTVPPVSVIRIGMTQPLSGAYAADGQMDLNGLQLWASNVNATGGIYVRSLGKKLPVQLIYYDDQSSTSRVAALYSQLAASGVNFFMAPYSSPLTLAAAAIAEQSRILIINPSGASDVVWSKGYNYVIGVMAPGSAWMHSVIDMLGSFKPKPSTIALFYGNDAFSISVFAGADAAKAYAIKEGFQIVYDQTYDESASDYTTQLTQIASLHPDVLLGGAHFVDGETIMKNIRSLGVNFNAVALVVAPDDPRFLSDLGPVADYILTPSQWEPNLDFSKFASYYGNITGTQFFSDFKSRFGITPNFEAAEAYTAGLTLEKAIYDCGDLNSTVIRNQLAKEDFYTFFGHFQIGPTGIQTGHPMVTVQWQSGVKQTVWPTTVATASPVYPMPPWSQRKL